jgi:hypothetical protein
MRSCCAGDADAKTSEKWWLVHHFLQSSSPVQTTNLPSVVQYRPDAERVN